MKQAEESKRRERVIQAAVVLLIIGGLIAFSQLAPDISLQSTLNDVAKKVGKWTYLLVGISAFIETAAFVGLVLPGETVVILGGAVAGQGETSVILTIGIVWVCAAAGDSVSFLLGRRLGRGFVMRHGPRVRITHERFARVEDYFSRHGGKTILVGRFIGLVRALAPFVAGSSGMRYTGFLPYSVLGTGLWAAGYVLLGYFASRSLDAAAHAAGQGTLFFGIAVVVIVGIVWAVRFLRDPANRDRLVAGMEERPLLRPLVALLAVSVYVVVGYTSTISAHPGPTPGDQAVLDFMDKIQVAWLVSLAKVVTTLGASAVVIPLAVIAVGFLAWERRWPEAAVIAIAVVIIYVGVAELKGLTDRPRPPDPLTGSEGSSFPSAHAAHSMLYPWLALTLVIRLRPGIAGGTALLVTGFVIAALVGLTRIYLRVHYMSDVTSGWALGAAAFCLCAAVAMLVTHLRNNS